MDLTYWLKQTDTPLFPDILWSRPEHESTAGKLTIIGGHQHGFSAPGQAYTAALAAGVGRVFVILPEAVKRVVRHVLPDAEYAPSNPSGSFSRQALTELLHASAWGDGVLLAGDFGRNSETAVVLESFVDSYKGLLTITHDAIDYFKETPKQVVDRPHTTLVLSLAQLQRLFIATPVITPITYGMTSLQLAEALHTYTQHHPVCIIVKHNDQIYVSEAGRVTTTRHTEKVWRVVTAARASVFWLQNPQSTLEAITTSLYHADSR